MLCIFDWDGTLSNSADKIVSCMQLAADDAKLPELPGSEVQKIIGLGLPEAISTLYPEGNQSQWNIMREMYSSHYVKADQIPAPLFEGVVEGLDKLKGEGFTLAVATGKSRRGLDRVLGRLGMEEYFHGSRCADETRSKPHPLMLEELLEEFDRAAGDAVMVGDTSFDLAMAEAIDMPRIGVSYGVHETDVLHQHGPDLMADHFTEVVDWIIGKGAKA
ncbi:HAD-IA family hydrolase [Pseudoteredinibacter isoporae]|uniref:Phosphoglycolate phosphatase n=1 Tax=Pseudoteredinibacter isoporae TaxID=570281 RepID=A0A7X0JTI6_9GAMM|nr:HAD-IA family hydrolase [Pseudoteredinibacter isoporae]MBB6521967.1 phosphoglycolate phosphatase [Pseudoteredinibacter isoporae]NHO87503.1 HAD-IA family hydrolase [Pseudoteredinibacter isoporae]NIB24166.1 HAD-IA family hydrolase [Pseudoteredinibacter isoporae]